jgi:hypothetical protein
MPVKPPLDPSGGKQTICRLLILAITRWRLLLDELFLRGGHLFLFRPPRVFVFRIRGRLGSQKFLQFFFNTKRAFVARVFNGFLVILFLMRFHAKFGSQRRRTVDLVR